MPLSIKLNFTLDKKKLTKDFNAKVKSNPDFNCLEIENVKSYKEGSEFIIKNLYEQIISRENVFGIILKIVDDVEENFNFIPRNSYFSSKPSFLLTFQLNSGNHETKIYWKSPPIDGFYSTFVDGDITDVLCDFLIQEIKAERSGVRKIHSGRKNIRLHEIVDNQDRDLLTIAVINGQIEAVRSLLNYDFVADNVIDLAWNLYLASNDIERPIRNQIILILLEANSKIPEEFEYDEASTEIQGFINWCEDLQKDVDNENLESLKRKLDSRPNLIYFYDRNNQSLLGHAIKTNKTKVFKTFARRLNTGSHEKIQNIYQTIQTANKRMMRKKRQQNLKDFFLTHLLVLKSKTRVSSNDTKHWEYIEEAYETINSIRYCSKILQVASECKNIQIFFDFKHDSTYYMDPATLVYSKGFIGGTIFIGAKDLLNEATKLNVFEVIINELCHVAVYFGFMNQNIDPFPTGESELKTRFIEHVMVQCKQNEELEPKIENVFKYPKEVQDSKMIMMYPQILMQYNEDEAKINNFERIFSELVKYSKKVVEPELDKALKVLKLLNDDNYLIGFRNLTEPMKTRILHSTIYFQGVETTLFELVGSNQQILKSLTSENIRKILLENKTIEIGEAVKLEMEYGIICRNFEKVLDANQVEKFTFENIREEASNSKAFLLADHAGSGKTTIFKDCTKKLKEFHKNSWVSFINLRKHGQIFEQYMKKINTLALGDVSQILLQIVNLKPGLEVSIFKKLFQDGKMILLFDGVDEISPIYTELLMKIFTLLCQMERKIETWISTRPHYAQKLSETLNTPYHKFTQYKPSEINEFINEILKFNGIIDKKEQKENLSQINKCMKGLKGFYYRSKEIENPLMVQMVTKLYIEKRVDPDNVSRYGVYEAMVEKQKDKVGEIIPNLERDQDFNLNIWDVHRVLALISLVGDDYKKELKFKLEDLQIMQKWKEEKHKWTSDMIQRYGFVIVDLSSENIDKSSIDFMHRTYAEFFVAQMFIKSFSSNSRGIYVDPRIIRLFAVIMSRPLKFYVVKDFVVSFLKTKISRNEDISFDKYKEVYTAEIQKIHQMQLGVQRCNALYKWIEQYETIVKLLDIGAFTSLWKLDEEPNLLKECFKSNDMKYDKKIIEYAEICFGSNWNETFNKSGTPLITVEEIAEFKTNSMTDSRWIDLQNILKFLDLVDKNYENEEKREIYANEVKKFNFFGSKFKREVISRARNLFDRTKFCETFLLKVDIRFVSIEGIQQILEIIEKDFIRSKNLLRKLLFESTERSKTPLCQLFNSNDIKSFLLIKDFYVKYKRSWKDIQDILVDVDSEDFFDQAHRLQYYNFKNLLKEAFGTDFSRLANKIESIERNIGYYSFSKENLEDLLNLISNDSEKVKNIISNLFK